MGFSTFLEEALKGEIQNPLCEDAVKRFWDMDDREEQDRKGWSMEDQRVIALLGEGRNTGRRPLSVTDTLQGR